MYTFPYFVFKIVQKLTLRRSILLVSLSIVSNTVYAQSDATLHKIILRWKLGDKKTINNKTSTKIFIRDSLMSETTFTSNYYIKVIDTINNFTVLYNGESNSVNVVSKTSFPKNDSSITIIKDIIKRLEQETKTFKYELIVDKSTGLAKKVKNSELFLKTVEKVTTKLIIDLSEKINNPQINIDSIKQKIITYYKEAEPKILETILNEYNYIMQPYSYEFPYNASISQKTMVHSVNALGELSDIEVPAVITISSKKNNHLITVETNTDYDKNFFLEQIKLKYKNLKHLTTADIFLVEKTTATFEIKNGWIVSHQSNVIFKTKEVKVVNETNVSFQ